MVRFNLVIRPDQVGRIDDIAARTGADRSALIRQAIDEFLARDERLRKKGGR